MRCVDADKLYPDCMTKNGTLAISQSQIADAPTVSIKSCRECPFVADEEKQITNDDAWESYCEGQEVGFKKAEDVFERMKLIQETVDCIRNTFNRDAESDKIVRNCMALVQNAIDGEFHDMEEVDVSKLERSQGKWIAVKLPITEEEGDIKIICSNCKDEFIGQNDLETWIKVYKYCPSCGAYMDEDMKRGKENE